MRVGHANLFALVDIRRSLHAMQHHRQHFCRRHAVFTFITKARNNARLIVVTPEQGIPCHVVHSLLPVAEQCFQRHKVRFSQRPFFTTGIIDLQVMKIKGHRQFTACQCRVSLAMLKAGGGHFTYGH